MSTFWKLLPIVAAASIQLAWAQAHDQHSAARASAPINHDPVDPRATVPPVRYQSSFSGYRQLRDVPVGSWRDANDAVGRIGGWRAYAREAAKAAPAMPAMPTSPTPDGRDGPVGRGGHEKH